MDTNLHKATSLSPNDLSEGIRGLLNNQTLHDSQELNSTRLLRAIHSGVFRDQHISAIASEIIHNRWLNSKHIGLEIDVDILCIWLGTKSFSLETTLDQQKQDKMRRFSLIRSDGLWDKRVATDLSTHQIISKLRHYARVYSMIGVWTDKIRKVLFGMTMGFPRNSLRNILLKTSFLSKILQSWYSLSVTKLNEVDNIYLVSLAGEIDLANHTEYQKRLYKSIPSRSKCIIDLSRFHYGSSIGPLPLVNILMICIRRRTKVAVINYDSRIVLEGLFRIGASTMLQPSLNDAISFLQHRKASTNNPKRIKTM